MRIADIMDSQRGVIVDAIFDDEYNVSIVIADLISGMTITFKIPSSSLEDDEEMLLALISAIGKELETIIVTTLKDLHESLK